MAAEKNFENKVKKYLNACDRALKEVIEETIKKTEKDGGN